jgi:hypothetical protein
MFRPPHTTNVPRARLTTNAVYLASMIGFPHHAVCSQAFNKLVPSIVAAHKAHGMRILFAPVEAWSGLCTDNSTDVPIGPLSGLSGLCCSKEVHPNAAGYLRMASAFALAIAEGPPILPAG